LDFDLSLCLFRDAFDTSGSVKTLKWSEWIQILSAHDVRGSESDGQSKESLDRAKNGPAMLAGTLHPGASRSLSGVAFLTAAILDLEDHETLGDLTDDAVLKILRGPLASLEWFAWTTHAHKAPAKGGGNRIRVLLPLASPVPASSWPAAWAAVNALIGGWNDPQTKDASRLHYFPSTYPGAESWTLHNPGSLLDLSNAVAYEPTPEGVSDVVVASTAARLRARLARIPATEPIKEVARRVLQGEPIAEAGDRHRAMRDVTWWIADAYPDLPVGVLEAVLAPSLAAAGEDGPQPSAARKAYEGGVAKLRQARRERARRSQLHEGESPWTSEDLHEIAKIQGWSAQDLPRRWLVQKDSTIYVLGPEGYLGPFSKDEASTAIVTLLARAPVDLYRPTEKGGWQAKAVPEILRGHGSVAAEVVADLTVQRSSFDPATATMREAVRPLRDLTPTRSPVVEGWLSSLVDADEDALSRLLDWLACAPDCSRLLCALYLSGARGAGKTLLAMGLARLWTEGPPVELERILGDFNEDLAALCPVVLGDEGLPRTWRGKATTAALRTMVSVHSRTLSRKYRAPAQLRGALRLILAANNDLLLDSTEIVTREDLEAVAQRFLHVAVSPAASDYLAGLGPDVRAQLVQGDEIARHVLWLWTERPVEPGGRFWVEGDVSAMHRLLLGGSRWTSLVCEFLVRYLQDPQKLENHLPGHVRREVGGLWVASDAIVQGWDHYLAHERERPDTRAVGTALGTLAPSGVQGRRSFRVGGRRVWCKPVDVAHLEAWIKDRGVGDVDALREAVKP